MVSTRPLFIIIYSFRIFHISIFQNKNIYHWVLWLTFFLLFWNCTPFILIFWAHDWDVIYSYPKNTTKIRICEISIGNPEIYETLTTLFFGSGTKLFITFLSLRFFDMRRDNFFLCWLFHLTQLREAPHRKLLVWPRPDQKSTTFLWHRISTVFFFKSSGHDIIHIPSPFPTGVFIVTSVRVTSSPHAREYLHSMCAPN